MKNDDKWIYDWVGFDSTCPKDIQKALDEANGEDITFRVSSGGGDVFAGNEIYYLINQYDGNTIADITGIAASIATVICCGANKVRAVPGAQYMIHNVSSDASGDYNAMDKASEILKNANKTISNTYKLKTKMSEESLLDMMNDQTWLDATKAKEYGFIDEIIGDEHFSNKSTSLYNASFVNVISDELKEKIRKNIKSPNERKEKLDNSDFMMQKEQITILRMRGMNL